MLLPAGVSGRTHVIKKKKGGRAGCHTDCHCCCLDVWGDECTVRMIDEVKVTGENVVRWIEKLNHIGWITFFLSFNFRKQYLPLRRPDLWGITSQLWRLHWVTWLLTLVQEVQVQVQVDECITLDHRCPASQTTYSCYYYLVITTTNNSRQHQIASLNTLDPLWCIVKWLVLINLSDTAVTTVLPVMISSFFPIPVAIWRIIIRRRSGLDTS